MSFALFISLSAFVAAAATIWVMATAFAKRPDRAAERLAVLTEPTDEQRRYQLPQELADKALRRLREAQQPAAGETRTELERDPSRLLLANAGFSSPLAPAILRLSQMAAGIAGLMIGGVAGLAIYGFHSHAWLHPLILGGLGYIGPVIALHVLKATRQRRIFRSVPDVLDMVVVCMEAGLGFDDAMRSVTEQFSDSAADVCHELQIYSMHLQLGRPRRDALFELGARIGIDDVKSLTTVLAQSERMGTPIVQALRAESNHMRIRRRQLAEEMAGKAAAKIILPLVLFIFPGIFVVLVGPAMPDLARLMRPAGSARPVTADLSGR